MNPHEFASMLQADGYNQAVPVERATGYALGEHQHPFDACALVTAGEITLTVAGTACRYGVGDIFQLPAGTAHHESVGPAGVHYLSGRRQRDAA